MPTLNEAANVAPLIAGLLSAGEASRIPFELLVVDDGSTDGTVARIEELGERARIRVLRGPGRGLAQAVVAAARSARGDVVVVMDADLSHPPAQAFSLAAEVLSGHADVAIASRHMDGANIEGWSQTRHAVSTAGTWIARRLSSARDPLSGYFAVRRTVLLELGARAIGFKIGLEILARGRGRLRVTEHPVSFRDRTAGVSKLGLGTLAAFALQIWRLLLDRALASASARRSLRSGAILCGELLLFATLGRAGASPQLAQMLAFLGTIPGALGSDPRYRDAAAGERVGAARAGVLFLAVLALRTAGFERVQADASAVWAICAAAGISAGVWWIGPQALAARTDAPQRSVATDALRLAAAAIALRIAGALAFDLTPQETYYWSYAQHLSGGYLDHPPMVAWLIAASTRLLGKDAFAVRLPALACGLATLGFLVGLTRNVAGRAAMPFALAMAALLPATMGTGILMTPDAPLLAAWAGALFCTERALLGGRRWAWVASGVLVGAGLLAKYTMGLFVLGAAVFLLLDPRARQAWRRPWPYLAALIATCEFLPVLRWNASHEWASFVFQGTRRWGAAPRFSPHVLAEQAAILLTPSLLVAIVFALVGAERKNLDADARSRVRFCTSFALAPLAVFVAFSLAHPTKLNWTAPAWLSTLPLIAGALAGTDVATRRLATLRRLLAWRAWCAALLVIFSIAIGWGALDLSGLPMRAKRRIPLAWRALAASVSAEARDVERIRGRAPLLAGLDRYDISSALAYYAPDATSADRVTARHIVGGDSLMWASWSPRQAAVGRDVVFATFEPEDLADERLRPYFRDLGPIRERVLVGRHAAIGRCFQRVGFSLREPPYASAANPRHLTIPR